MSFHFGALDIFLVTAKETRRVLKKIWVHNRLQSDWLEMWETFCGSEGHRQFYVGTVEIPDGIEVESLVTPLSMKWLSGEIRLLQHNAGESCW
jgi:hypothetical protein